jgi:hypothetical protein
MTSRGCQRFLTQADDVRHRHRQLEVVLVAMIVVGERLGRSAMSFGSLCGLFWQTGTRGASHAAR